MLKRYIIHYPTLLRLGIPIMIGQTGSIIMGFMDTVMIGHYGTGELAAAGFVNGIIGLASISALGFSYGLTPVAGALLGKGETGSIAQKLKNSLVANNILAIAMMTALGVLYMNLHHLGLPNHLLPMMRPYLLLNILSFIPMMAFNAFKQFSDGIQDTHMPMWILIGSNVLNVLGNWLLIYGIGGLPEMGLTGAGVATLLSRFAMWATFAVIFHLTDRYKKYSHDFWKASVNKADLNQLFRLGIPIMLQMGMETASFSLSAFYVGWLGTTALAAHQVMLTVAQLCYMLYYGMSAAVAIQVSYFRGAGKLPDTRHVAFAGLHHNLVSRKYPHRRMPQWWKGWWLAGSWGAWDMRNSLMNVSLGYDFNDVHGVRLNYSYSHIDSHNVLYFKQTYLNLFGLDYMMNIRNAFVGYDPQRAAQYGLSERGRTGGKACNRNSADYP